MASVQPKTFNSGGPRTLRYRVRKGDSLWKIASEQYGDPTLWHRISAANGLKNSDRILIGEVLRLPPPQRDAGKPPEPQRILSVLASTLAHRLLRFGFKISGHTYSQKITVPVTPFATLTLKLTGEPAIERDEGPQIIGFSRTELELQRKLEAAKASPKLFAGAKFKFTRPNQVQLVFGAEGGPVLESSVGISAQGSSTTYTYNCTVKEISFERPPYKVTGTMGFEAELKVRNDVPWEQWCSICLVPGLLAEDLLPYMVLAL
jgi:LysM repeat protein